MRQVKLQKKKKEKENTIINNKHEPIKENFK